MPQSTEVLQFSDLDGALRSSHHVAPKPHGERRHSDLLPEGTCLRLPEVVWSHTWHISDIGCSHSRCPKPLVRTHLQRLLTRVGQLGGSCSLCGCIFDISVLGELKGERKPAGNDVGR